MIQNQVVNLADLQPHSRNYNAHGDAQIARIAKSLQTFGQVRSIVCWRNTILAGHGVVLAALSLGWESIRADVVDELSEDAALAYVVADNELARQSDPDQAQLAAILEELQQREPLLVEAAGYSTAELEQLLRLVKKQEPVDAEPQVDRAQELQAQWGTATGQLWQLGEHRLICGDCTDAAVVARVMDGDKADLLFTSPPYAQQRDYDSDIGDWDELMQGAFAAAICADSCQVLVNLGLVHEDGEWIPYWADWIEWMRSQGWRRFGWYVWDQGAGLPGDWSGRLAPSFEFVFHFKRITVRAEKWVDSKMAGQIADHRTFRHDDGRLKPFTQNGVAYGDTKISDSVIRVNRQIGDTGHPAPFSVDFAASVIRSWAGSIVFDPFAGSGTTGIACQNLGRKARMIEISEAYTAVILERFCQIGITPELIESPQLEGA